MGELTGWMQRECAMMMLYGWMDGSVCVSDGKIKWIGIVLIGFVDRMSSVVEEIGAIEIEIYEMFTE